MAANKDLTADQRLAVLEAQVKALNDQVVAYLEQRRPPSFLEAIKGVPFDINSKQAQPSFVDLCMPTLIDTDSKQVQPSFIETLRPTLIDI